jgi:hypothetical protein
LAELVRQLWRPAAFAQGVNLHPDPTLPLTQLKRAAATWNPQMPVLAAGPTGKLALTLNGQPAALTLSEGLFGSQVEI